MLYFDILCFMLVLLVKASLYWVFCLFVFCLFRCTTCGEYIYKGKKFNARKVMWTFAVYPRVWTHTSWIENFTTTLCTSLQPSANITTQWTARAMRTAETITVITDCSSQLKVSPFTPKSDQFQISPTASPEILHHTVWRTWLFKAHSNEMRTYNKFSLPHLYIYLWKVGRNIFKLEWRG